MRIPTQAIVSNSDMIKNYKTCREKAEKLSRLFIVKNNRLDAVLMPISEYEKLVELTNDLGNDVSSSKFTVTYSPLSFIIGSSKLKDIVSTSVSLALGEAIAPAPDITKAPIISIGIIFFIVLSHTILLHNSI